MSISLDKKEYFQKCIVLEPINGDDETIQELIAMAKNILAEAAVNYVNKGERFTQKMHLNNGEENGYTLKILPDKKGARVIQIAHSDVLITKIDFWQLCSTYLNNSYDFDLVEGMVSTSIENVVYCDSYSKSNFAKYLDKIQMAQLKPYYTTFSPLVEKAKNFITEAMVHYILTKENSITDQHFCLPKIDGNNETKSLHLKKIDTGVRIEQLHECLSRSTIKKSYYNIEIDFEKLIKLSDISEKLSSVDEKKVRKQINIPFIHKFQNGFEKVIVDIIVDSAKHYFMHHEQIINNKIEIIGFNEHKDSNLKNSLLQIELIGEEDGIQVSQIFTSKLNDEDIKECTTHWIDFNAFNLEDSWYVFWR